LRYYPAVNPNRASLEDSIKPSAYGEVSVNRVLVETANSDVRI
jgi:hypothetical protein